MFAVGAPVHMTWKPAMSRWPSRWEPRGSLLLKIASGSCSIFAYAVGKK
jgi:hypothetical protein